MDSIKALTSLCYLDAARDDFVPHAAIDPFVEIVFHPARHASVLGESLKICDNAGLCWRNFGFSRTGLVINFLTVDDCLRFQLLFGDDAIEQYR